MKIKIVLLVSFLMISELLMSAGYTLPLFGSRDTARGGAFMVKSDDLTAVVHNPANIIKLKGFNTYLGLGIINTSGDMEYYDRGFDNDPSTYFKTVSNSPDPFFNPNIAISDNFGLKKFNFSIAVHGPYAPDYKYDKKCSAGDQPTCPNRYSLYESDITLANLQLTIAYQALKNLSIGVGLKATYINFKYDLDLINASESLAFLNQESKEGKTDVNLKFDVTDAVNFNAILGLTYNINQYISLAATYQTPISVDADGTMDTEIYESSQILNDTQTTIEGDDLNVKLNLPHIFGFGILFEVKNKFNIELDFNMELWSVHDKVVITPVDVSSKYMALGAEVETKLEPITQTKNWENTYNISLGGDIIFLDNTFILSLGAFYESGAIPDEYFDVSIVDSDKYGIGFGISYTWDFLTFNTSFSYIDFLTRDITNSKVYVGNALQNEYPTDFIVGNGKFDTDILIFSTGVSFRF